MLSRNTTEPIYLCAGLYTLTNNFVLYSEISKLVVQFVFLASAHQKAAIEASCVLHFFNLSCTLICVWSSAYLKIPFPISNVDVVN